MIVIKNHSYMVIIYYLLEIKTDFVSYFNIIGFKIIINNKVTKYFIIK
jgi:hypothetical protein